LGEGLIDKMTYNTWLTCGFTV